MTHDQEAVQQAFTEIADKLMVPETAARGHTYWTCPLCESESVEENYPMIHGEECPLSIVADALGLT